MASGKELTTVVPSENQLGPIGYGSCKSSVMAMNVTDEAGKCRVCATVLMLVLKSLCTVSHGEQNSNMEKVLFLDYTTMTYAMLLLSLLWYFI
jgi:hypothetical protein